MRPRVAFVVQRYGLEVTGGAELECRRIAELMADVWDVTVLTTCALDYYTWGNHYVAGKENINGVNVKRYQIRKKRNVKKFNKISDRIFGKSHSKEDELSWMAAQGPDVPELVEAIKAQEDDFDAFIFFTYLYATTFWSLPHVATKSLLVPTAHDEPPIYLSIFEELFAKPRGFIFNSPEEKAFLKRKFDINTSLSDIIGVGVQTDFIFDAENSYSEYFPENYVIYVGRIDGSKGCPEMFDYWHRYKAKYNGDLKLLLVGHAQMAIPEHKDIVPLGFLSEEEKFSAITGAQCLIMPSPFESLSIVLLEAWLCNRPVLVNGKCDVLKGQCRRSNGGLWYENYDEFEACLNFFLNENETALKMAANGKRFVELNYSWDEIKRKYIALLDRLLNLN
jgi:glycosyltransferase involved in cell wall biosynthesis